MKLNYGTISKLVLFSLLGFYTPAFSEELNPTLVEYKKSPISGCPIGEQSLDLDGWSVVMGIGRGMAMGEDACETLDRSDAIDAFEEAKENYFRACNEAGGLASIEGTAVVLCSTGGSNPPIYSWLKKARFNCCKYVGADIETAP